MKMEKILVAMVLVCIFAGGTVFAQQKQIQPVQTPQGGNGNGNGGGGTTSKSTSNANSGASATINNVGGSDNRGLVQAVPGVIGPSALPAIPITPDGWQRCPTESSITLGEFEGYKKRRKLKEGQLVVAGKPGGDMFHFLNWWPLSGEGPHLKMVAQSIAMGKPGSPSMEVLAPEILAAVKQGRKEGYEINAAACRYRATPAMVTTETTKGFGGSFSRMFSADNNGGGVSAGYAKGTNISGPVDRASIEIIFYALPDGPFEWAPTPQKPLDPPLQQSQPEKSPEAQVQAAPVVQPVVTDVREVPPVVQQTPPAENSCDGFEEITDIEVHFPWDGSDVKMELFPASPREPYKIITPGNQEKLQKLANWLNRHTACRLQAEGFACKLGTKDHNAALGYRRAEALRDALMSMLSQEAKQTIVQYVSVGKQFAGSEYDWHDRKATLRVITVK
jgi:hypothetical protein